MALAAVSYGFTLKYDVSLPTKHFYEIVDKVKAHIQQTDSLTEEEKKAIRTCGYGHIGDGNLHLNVSAPGYDDQDV